MISFLPLRDKALLERLNSQSGADAALAYCMYEKDKLSGWILYDIDGEEGVIEAISAPDEDCFDGLVRAVLASLVDISVDRVRFASSVDFSLLQKLGFAKKGESVLSPIEEVLYHCKNCENERK